VDAGSVRGEKLGSSEEVAWVTGSGTGIDRAVALELAKRGRDVAVPLLAVGPWPPSFSSEVPYAG
jgi:hypothetical protein